MTQLTTPKTIIIIDDDPQNRLIVVEQLIQNNSMYKVLSAPSGEIGLKLMSRHATDLVLLDWEMPRMNGIEVLQQMKQNEQLKTIPVVMYTGIMTGASSLQVALDAGADDFLRKPADPIELFARINSVLLKHEYQKAQIKSEKEKYNLKVQEISSLLLQINQRNTLLQELKVDLESIDMPNLALRKILQKVNRILDSADDWEQIKPRIESLHQGFINQLSLQHNSLSYNQIIFCALLRMGLHGKEIARILGISYDAIEKNRYRIRKKLELNSEDSLETYLAGIV